MVMLLLLIGCAAPVHVEKDPATDFGKYKTYAWIDENNGKKGTANDLEERSVHEAVSKELVNSGWKEVTNNPDVLISYDVLVERTTKLQTIRCIPGPLQDCISILIPGVMVPFIIRHSFGDMIITMCR